MKKYTLGILMLAFTVSFLSACNAYTPGPVTTRSQAVPIPVPTTEEIAVETTTEAPTTAAPETTMDANIWVETSAVETTEAKVYVYAVAGVNVREGSTKNSDVIGTLSEGDQVEKLGEEGKWVKIDYKGTPAYVYGQYLSEEKP